MYIVHQDGFKKATFLGISYFIIQKQNSRWLNLNTRIQRCAAAAAARMAQVEEIFVRMFMLIL
jgi:hypothetical protein